VNAKPVDISPNIKSRILAVYESNSRTGDAAFDETDPTFLYACLKTQHEELSSEPRSQLITEQLRQLEQNLVDISKDYLFDEKEALALYRKERDNAIQCHLQERLRSPLSSMEPRPNVAPKKLDVLPPISTDSQAVTDIFDGDDTDDSESTGLLGFLEDTDPNEITVKGVTYRLREMAIAKHWSGPMPKTVLRDFVAKEDKYAAISYTIISGQSRANRASISIAWRGNKRDLWSMDDIACPTAPQAEQYIATVALHSLTYPLTDGFISSSPASTSNSTSFRLLPASYRDLWDELEAARKERDNQLNRAIWGQLLNIAKDKIQRDSDV
jgi:ATP-dependent RNA helicase DHX29